MRIRQWRLASKCRQLGPHPVHFLVVALYLQTSVAVAPNDHSIVAFQVMLLCLCVVTLALGILPPPAARPRLEYDTDITLACR